jgi:uncharacterized protein (TIGR03437 family)
MLTHRRLLTLFLLIAAAQLKATTFGPARYYPIGREINTRPFVGDFNGDGIPDVMVGGAPPAVFYGNGDGTFRDAGSPWPGVCSGFLQKLVDLNHDGIPDLYSCYMVYLGKRGGGFGEPTFLQSLNSLTGIVQLYTELVQDVNGDGFPDVVFTASGKVIVLFNHGDGTFPTFLVSAVLPNALVAGIAAVDMNRDGKMDIVLTLNNPDEVMILYGNGDGSFQAGPAYGAMQTPMGIVAADFNEDGSPDIAVLNGNGGTMEIYLNDRTGKLRWTDTLDRMGGFSDPIAADMDGDGHLDLVCNKSWPVILFGAGDGTFSRRVEFLETSSQGNYAVADLNRDGRPDLVFTTLRPSALGIRLSVVTGSSLTATAAPNPAIVGQTFGITALLAAPQSFEVLTGSVQVSEGVALLGSAAVVGSTARFTVGAAPIGTHTYSLRWNGLAGVTGSQTSVTQLVIKSPVTVAIDMPMKIVYGTVGAIRAHVVAQSGIHPTGTVVFSAAGRELGRAALDNLGQAVPTVPIQIAPGDYPVTAAYEGDSNCAPGASTLTMTIVPAETRITVALPAGATGGTPLTLQAYIDVVAPGTGSPTGNVWFLDGSQRIAGGSIDSMGGASASVTLSAGVHQISAVYSGDINFGQSTSGVVTAALKASSTTRLAVSATRINDGETVGLTGTVIGAAGAAPAGTMTFADGGRSVAVVPVDDSGQAQTIIRLSGAGIHHLTASFSGNSSLFASVSTAVGVEVDARVLPPPITVVSAASGGALVAPESIASAYSAAIAGPAQTAKNPGGSLTIASLAVRIRDSAGIERPAPLFAVVPGQVNFVVSAGSAVGPGTIKVLSGSDEIATGPIDIATVAPGVFSANGSGTGVAAALVVNREVDGVTTTTGLAACDATGCSPVAVGVSSGSTVLELFATGLRHVRSSDQVTVMIGDVSAAVQYAGGQPEFAGLDQVNILLPPELAGRGEVPIVLTADGLRANIVTIRIR